MCTPTYHERVLIPNFDPANDVKETEFFERRHMHAEESAGRLLEGLQTVCINKQEL